MLKGRQTKKGYLLVALYNNGISKSIAIHRLVATHFIPNPKNLPQVNHIDGKKSNNCYTNLEWCTNQENIIHAYELGLEKRKLSKQDILEIKKLYSTGLYTQKYIGDKYGVCQQHIQKLVSDKRG